MISGISGLVVGRRTNECELRVSDSEVTVRSVLRTWHVRRDEIRGISAKPVFVGRYCLRLDVDGRRWMHHIAVFAIPNSAESSVCLEVVEIVRSL